MAGSGKSRFLMMFTLVFAGEIIFSLPFHVPRFFRPTMLEVFSFSNTELGDVFAFYGVMAMICYFPGGVIADRFSDRKLMATSLIATSVGSLVFIRVPSFASAAALYAYWGVTSILLFWSAMIRATRNWGGKLAQGRAFGILDGGRGLIAAGAATIAVLALGNVLPDDVAASSAEDRRTGLQLVILFYAFLTLLAAALVWFFIPETTDNGTDERQHHPLEGMLDVLRRPIVWSQAAIVACAYCGYKGLDNYALYAVQVLEMNEVEGARLAANGAFIRPVAALLAGFLADRLLASRVTAITFAMLAIAYGILAIAVPSPAWINVIYGNLIVSFFGVYAIRGIYFALLEEVRTPVHLTGTSVGLISLVGFTPDVFFAPIAGRILDNSPGVAGHQHYFAFLSAIMLLGVVFVLALTILNRRRDARIDAMQPESRA